MLYHKKMVIKNILLTKANIRQIHIIGCARSGTTMLHYSMIAFINTILHDEETFVWTYPTLKQSALLFKRFIFDNKTHFYVTKRSYGWFEQEYIDDLIEYVEKFNVYLINIVRDPRDVLTSKHLKKSKDYYVEPWRWEKSINAGNFIFKSLKNHRNKITIRFEDVISKSIEVENRLKNTIGLKLRPNIKSWKKLKHNLSIVQQECEMAEYMHKIRNFDANAIGKWKKDSVKVNYINDLLTKSKYKDKIREMMYKFNYQFNCD